VSLNYTPLDQNEKPTSWLGIERWPLSLASRILSFGDAAGFLIIIQGWKSLETNQILKYGVSRDKKIPPRYGFLCTFRLSLFLLLENATMK
jgi:hypothetical protein